MDTAMDIDPANLATRSNLYVESSITKFQSTVFSLILEAKNRILDLDLEEDIDTLATYTTIYNFNSLPLEPTIVRKVLRSPKEPKWKDAITTKLSQIFYRDTFKYIRKDILKRAPITTRWVFLCKLDIEGNISKYKARLVIRGFQ